MRKKPQLDPSKAEAESLAFIKKVKPTQLNKVTSHRKKETKLKQHRFDYIQAASTMKLQAKALEDDLDKFLADKLADSPVRTMWADMKYCTDAMASSIGYKITSVNYLREQLGRQAKMLSTFEEKESWLERAELLAAMFQEVKGAIYTEKEELMAEDLKLPELEVDEKLPLILSIPDLPG